MSWISIPRSIKFLSILDRPRRVNGIKTSYLLVTAIEYSGTNGTNFFSCSPISSGILQYTSNLPTIIYTFFAYAHNTLHHLYFVFWGENFSFLVSLSLVPSPLSFLFLPVSLDRFQVPGLDYARIEGGPLGLTWSDRACNGTDFQTLFCLDLQRTLSVLSLFFRGRLHFNQYNLTF